MRPHRYTWRTVLFLIFCQVSFPGFSQLGINFDIKKPKEYEDRVLRSERSDQKKFTLPRRFIQNTVTHYNYYFNANNKLNEVLERAKMSFTDDFSRLLPFYNFSLDVTAADSIQLDSISYKASTGVALHDLRNDWVDNLYLLWGASYYLRKEFDSAYLMFQFINYAFAPKEKDGYYITIGSSMDGNSANSISTREKNSLPRRVFSEPPSRNDAFIWQTRNFLAQDQLAEAASLIVTLRNDPLFPKRLQSDLHEVQAYWFYKQGMWDSSATHLVQALDNATNLQEKARWEFLAAQLFEMAGNFKESEKYYTRVSTHTTDPIMDIYARLYAIRVNKDEGERTIEKNVAELLKMAKRDKYDGYEDIIYYMAAQMQLQGNNIEAALALLQKSAEFTTNNPGIRNKIFLQLAELSYARKQYRQAYNFYDSLKMDDPALKNKEEITTRKAMLGRLATSIEIIERQDSLQRIAAMPEEEQREFIRKLVRDIRRNQGLKDDPGGRSNPIVISNNLFPVNEPRGEWYFYNSNSRTRGQGEFRSRWGNRPNVDNWRRSAVLTGMGQINQNITQNPTGPKQGSGTGTGSNGEVSFESLYANLPLTPEQRRQSDDSIKNALFVLGKTYIQEIEDCTEGIATLESLRTRFPDFVQMDEVLFNLFYCYTKNGETQKAAAIRTLMNEKYQNSHFTTIVVSGKNPKLSAREEATDIYERIYDLFIEGNFSQAAEEKKQADARFGTTYWTPQLLYIESVYYIRERRDSIAKSILNSIISRFPDSPLKPKAANLLDVLSRRAQIEEELRNLNVTRYADSATGAKPVVVTNVSNNPPRDTTTTQPPIVTRPQPARDTVAVKPVVKTDSPFTFNAEEPHYVVLVMNKVDPVFGNEARNAFSRYNRDTYYNKTFSVDLFQLDTDNRLLMIAPFTNAADALAYVEKARPKTPTEILPWLRGGKYTFTIMTDGNFNLLKENKDVEKYKSFLNEHMPGKF
jgi:predicted negative regulator of RcsB-dependent stress response